MELPKLMMAQTLADLEILHETKGRSKLNKFLRDLRDKSKSKVNRVSIKDIEDDLATGPVFIVELDGDRSVISQALHSELKKELEALGYKHEKVSDFIAKFKLSDNTPLDKARPLSVVTHGELYEIKSQSGSELFTPEVAAKAILGLKEDNESAKDALKAIKNGTYYRDLGVGTSMSKAESMKLESALYMLHELLYDKGM